MAELLTAAEMRQAEQSAFATGAATGLELMERAGRGVVEAIFAEWPSLVQSPGRAVVLAGPGNNGGDGFVIARLLHDWGWKVDVFLLGVPDRLPPDARANHDRWLERGAVSAVPVNDMPGPAGGQAVLIDAMFGTGLGRPLGDEVVEGALAPFDRPEYRDWLRVAVDIPSGLCADSGRVLKTAEGRGTAFRADLTVSFHAAKCGHHLSEGPQYCGVLRIAPIGLRAANARARLCDGPELGALSKPQGHKYSHGHALVLSGGAGRTGAARLAARAALRIGAGLVTLGVPGSGQQEAAAQLTAIMLKRVNDAADLSGVLSDARINALCLGPGLGTDRAGALVAAALNAPHRPALVLDADALTALAAAPEMLAALHGNCVLTPHDGEFARLFPDLADRLRAAPDTGPAYSRIDAAVAAAARTGACVLLKGPDTIIARPEGEVSLCAATYDAAVPWLATAGAGDVLAGLIVGLMARGVAPDAAAALGAWLHTAAARRFGPGLIAEDLPEMIPAVLRETGA